MHNHCNITLAPSLNCFGYVHCVVLTDSIKIANLWLLLHGSEEATKSKFSQHIKLIIQCYTNKGDFAQLYKK